MICSGIGGWLRRIVVEVFRGANICNRVRGCYIGMAAHTLGR